MKDPLDSPITAEMMKQAEARRQLFVQEVMYCSDATERETEASGWKTRGKIAWIESICKGYRKDMHKILKD